MVGRKREYYMQFDAAHTFMFNEYPAEYIKTIGVPGHFVRFSNRKVLLNNGITGFMDSAFILDPDGEILTERVAACLEHQSTPVDQEKLEKMGDYDIQLVSDENLPTLIIVASHLSSRKSKTILRRSPSDVTILYFLDLGEKDNRRRLTRLSKLIENNQHLTTEDALNLGVILLYAPRECACEITEKVVNLYLAIHDDLDRKMEKCLYSVFSVLIDAFFDDETEYRRLMDMVNGITSKEAIDEFDATAKSFMERIEWTEEELARSNAMVHELGVENSGLKTKNSELGVENSGLKAKNSELGVENSGLKVENAELKAEVARLTAALNGK
ncbi:hypothetical protein [Methanobrevibacter millerae]|uniref:Uncharacterized protein n=1 Tax=Methanobrevibacter millerae TaxID=230361 RepID=A0A1G5W3S0_9EURY|nr:hypothetical protein [Methanobrevibacter millerae]SDA52346.1 hypothetical protein SAMN02910315_01101 [Methanobrevibacter millerae]